MLPTGTHVSHTSQQLGDKPRPPALEPLPPTEPESREAGCLLFPFIPNGLQSSGGKGKNPDFYLFFVWHLSAPEDKGLVQNWIVSPGQHQHGCNMHPAAYGWGLFCKHTSLIRFSQGHIPSAGMSPEARMTTTLPSHAASLGLSTKQALSPCRHRG